MSDEPLAREPEPIERERARLEALARANAAPRCAARSKRTGKPCRGAAMPNGRCKVHGGKSTGPRTPEGLERSRRANWKHGHFRGKPKRTVAPAGGNTCASRSVRLDLRPPRPHGQIRTGLAHVMASHFLFGQSSSAARAQARICDNPWPTIPGLQGPKNHARPYWARRPWPWANHRYLADTA
jgi:hypothetical protein